MITTLSHQKMQTFFSSVDSQELKDQAPNYEYFLSLIVNFDGNYTARISFCGEGEPEIIYNTKFGKYKINSNKNVIFVLDCDIEFEIDQNIKTRLESLKPVVQEPRYLNPGGTSYQGQIWTPENNYSRYGGNGSKAVRSMYEDSEEIHPSITSTNAHPYRIITEILQHPEVNIKNLSITNVMLDNLKMYEMIDEDTLNEIEMGVYNSMDDIVRRLNHWSIKDQHYEQRMIETWKDCAQYLEKQIQYLGEMNVFTYFLINTFVEEINQLMNEEGEFEAYIKKYNLEIYAE